MPITDRKINGSFYFQIQTHKSRSFFFPAIEILDASGGRGLYPMVSRFDDIKNIPEIAFFKPKTTEQKLALEQYNIAHYHPSSVVEPLIILGLEVDAREQINAEIKDMDDLGIAFKK